MDFIPDYINRKHGASRSIIPHPLLEKVVGSTYGIMVYQEQVMQSAQVVAGYTLGGADMLRRAMGKKKAEEMAEQRSIFVAGAAKNNIDEKKANEIFDTMEKFAGYGFNKSHAAAYSLVAYQTAYLKCHYPAAFMASTMTSEMDNTDKVQFLLSGHGAAGRCHPAAGHQLVRFPFRAGGREDHRLRSGRDQGHRRGGGREHRCRRARRARSRICSISAVAWTSASSTAAPSRR